MIALARKDVHVRRRPTPDLRIVDPGHLRATDDERGGVRTAARDPGGCGAGDPRQALMHDHDHDHDQAPSCPRRSSASARSRAILVEKGYVDPAALDVLIETYETKVGPHNGARVVARAWADPGVPRWLLADSGAAIASLGYTGRQGENIVAVENTPDVHNMVVCTLCSCYPWPVLGLPPVWYKSAPYRSRAVADPRGVLRDFGVELPADTRDPRVGLDRGAALPRRPDAARRAPTAGARTSSRRS